MKQQTYIGRQSDLISVLIPAYKAGNYLDRCLKSVIKQSYKNLEIIIVVQPSPDDTVRNAHRWEERDSRVIVIDQNDADLSTARNNLLEHAHGSRVCFVDNDDILNMDHIWAMDSIMMREGVDIVQGVTYAFKDESQLNIDKISEEDLQNVILMSGREYTRGILNNTFGSDGTVTYTKLFKRSLFEGIKYPEGRVVDDVSTTYKVAWKAKKVAYFRIPTYYYQSERNDSMTHNHSFSTKIFLDGMMARIEQVHFFEVRDVEIYDIAVYNLCNDFSRLKGNAITVENELILKEFKCYRQYLLNGIKSSISFKKKIILLIGFYFPLFASKLRLLRYNINYRRQWKNKG